MFTIGNAARDPVSIEIGLGVVPAVKKLLETICECVCATVSERFTLADRFFSFGVDD
jgi:hypothetical protein